MLGLQVPTSWATWSGGNEPAVLYTQGMDYLTATFSPTEVQSFGLELEPEAFDTFLMTLTLTDGSIFTLGQFVDGLAGAKFFGWTDGDILTMEIYCGGIEEECGGFAIGRMVKAHPVAEPATLLLLGSGMAALGLWARRKYTS